jgi:glutamate-1-semialdehyde 2,1-aminomutase
VSDLQFTSRYRVPFQYMTDLDGNVFYDLTGSYGVNLFGYDFYKECIDAASRGCVSSARCSVPTTPACRQRRAPAAISGLDEVSFHMSGTEAVMQAVRLARYHTGRSHLVRFCGAYHGWWDDVQPGPATRCHRARPTRCATCTSDR